MHLDELDLWLLWSVGQQSIGLSVRTFIHLLKRFLLHTRAKLPTEIYARACVCVCVFPISSFESGDRFSGKLVLRILNAIISNTLKSIIIITCKRVRYALFWDITRRLIVIVYRRFGTTYRSHLQGSPRTLDPWRWDRYVVPKRR
jgi:hypothetical protein